MEIVAGDLLTIEGKKYITLEELVYEESKYIFVNLMTNDEEVTEEFYIFEVIGDSVNMVEEEKLKNILIPRFQKMLENDLKKLMDE